MKEKLPNLNIYIQSILVDHLDFTTADLLRNEKILRVAHDILKDNFLKLIIDIKEAIERKKIESPQEKIKYFMGAVRKTLHEKGTLKR